VAAPPPPALPTAPPWWKRLRAEPSVPVRLALGAAMVGVVFAIWWFVTRGEPEFRMVSPNRITSPGETFESLGRLFERHLGDAVIATLQRVFTGVGLAALVGITLGILAGSNRGVAAALAPIVIFLRSVPMGAMVPLTLLLCGGVGEKQKAIFLFLAIVPFVFSDSVKAVSLVPERYVETALTLGASKRQIIWKVLVPLALPDIITSLRFQVGLALGYITLTEAIDTPTGIGQLLDSSVHPGPYEHLYLLLFVIALLAFGIDLVLRTLQRGAFAWRSDL
jgi:ABC-type nitrate/sulfonate/bicarbonate transport system permease component